MRPNENVLGIRAPGSRSEGIAYGSTTRDWSEVVVISRWSGGQNDIQEKVPTRIAYADENNFSIDRWGYDVKSGMTSTQWFKLLLDSNTRVTDFDDPQLQQSIGTTLMRLPEGKCAEEVASDFLSMLYSHTISSLSDLIGRTALEQTAIIFSITTPATWSLAARQATRTAAESAGFGSRWRDEIILTDEPEAAAIFALKSVVTAFDAKPFQPNTCVLIVDCGGGTLDLITYRILKTDPLQLEEACIGEGGKCGATWIDRNLHKLMQERFATAFTSLPSTKTGAQSIFMETFEGIKRDFNGNNGEERVYELPLKMKRLDEDDPEMAEIYDFEEDLVRITDADIEAMFDPVVEKMFELVRKQLRSVQKAKVPPVRTIVLCGGLGSSSYMKKRLQNLIDCELKGKPELVVPPRPWSAIVRGAVIRGLEKSPVTYRRCRHHIGVTVHEKFVEGVHCADDLFFCPKEGRRAKNKMLWHVKRGEKVSANLKRPIQCYVVVHETDISKSEYIVYQDFYASESKDAPERIDSEADETDVWKVGRMKINLVKAVGPERARLKAQTGRYPAHLAFDITLELTLGSDKGVLQIEAKQGRKVFGMVSIEYEYDPAHRGVLGSSDD
ncbi:uncharacterized protein A1O9_04151 [Exophiala aquamarina CBS 119918]|uniref:Actin-like ATPase domain-containing protein n=1 Tax=Exophiala aquamarina CBS 119918 TaxID=1182545 RepID=A0A072PHV8_9EURO|nr:uncharacterized protein A1O9_04151 [Exophiala aquamarina CBS 119918]KEF59307.1 hypothetical protein A1O9_04151 [Exophiala aquamarina CBS 119918]